MVFIILRNIYRLNSSAGSIVEYVIPYFKSQNFNYFNCPNCPNCPNYPNGPNSPGGPGGPRGPCGPGGLLIGS